MPLEKGIDFDKLSRGSEGWTGAEVESVCRNAGINSIKRNYKEDDLGKVTITSDDFSKAFETVKKQKDDEKRAETAPMPGMPDMNEVMKSLPKEDEKKVNDKMAE